MASDQDKTDTLIADGVHVHSVTKTEFDPAFLAQPYKTPYQLHQDGFSEEFLEDALSKIQHKLFGTWGLIGEKGGNDSRSEEHTSELQSLMRISYAVFCLKNKTNHIQHSIPPQS